MFRTAVLTAMVVALSGAAAKADAGWGVRAGRGGVVVSNGYGYYGYHRGYDHTWPHYYGYRTYSPYVSYPAYSYYYSPTYVPSYSYAYPAPVTTYVAPSTAYVAPVRNYVDTAVPVSGGVSVRYSGSMPAGGQTAYNVRHSVTGMNFTIDVPAAGLNKVRNFTNGMVLKYDRGDVEVHFNSDGSASVQYDF